MAGFDASIDLSKLEFGETDRVRLLEDGEPHGATWYIRDFTNFDCVLAQMLDAGIRHALLDLDGTFTLVNHHDRMTTEGVAAILAMRASLDTVSVATNSAMDISRLQERFGFDYLFHAMMAGESPVYKCDRQYFEHVLAMLAVPPETVVMFGDNPYHDLRAADHGIHTVLVDPFDPNGYLMDERKLFPEWYEQRLAEQAAGQQSI